MIKFIDDEKIFEGRKVIFIYGVAGNPIHIGHIKALDKMLNVSDAEIRIVLSKKHAFGKVMMDYNERKKILKLMLNLYLTKEKRSRIIIDDVELKIEKNEAIYSYDIQNYYNNKYPQKIKVWAFGEDNCTEDNIKKFKNYNLIISWPILKLNEEILIHSTEIREMIFNEDRKKLSEYYNQEMIDYFFKLKNKNNDWIVKNVKK